MHQDTIRVIDALLKPHIDIIDLSYLVVKKNMPSTFPIPNIDKQMPDIDESAGFLRYDRH